MKNLYFKSKISILALAGLAVLLFSCKPTSSVNQNIIHGRDSVKITFTANNISENMTGNDEILVLIYVSQDTLKKAIVQKNLEFNHQGANQQFFFAWPKPVSQSLILFMIEQDSERPIPEIESAVRAHHKMILKEFAGRNYSGLEKYIGDEDLLGYKTIPSFDCQSSFGFVIGGIYKLDKYEYKVELQCR